MDAEVRTTRAGDLAVHSIVERYPLGPGLWLTLTPDGDLWRCAVEPRPTSGEPVYGADALTHLLRDPTVAPVDGFELVRHLSSPEASGERPVDDDGQIVVVGERVVVARARTVRDIPYTAPVTLAQLAAIDFLGVPDTHGLLLWTTPLGHQAPVAIITRYLPRAIDGRTALLRLLARGPAAERGESPSLAARMGRIVAALHVALATRTEVLPDPVTPATPAQLTAWHERVRGTIDRAALIAAEGTVPGVGQHLLGRLPTLVADADLLATVADSGHEVTLQRVHGDLHVARVLRWPGGLALTGFGDEPASDPSFLAPQPAARDLARLLQSLGEVAASVDEQAGTSACTADWLPDARQRLIASYRTELAVAGRAELFDERLLAAFEAEHTAREVIDAAHRQAAAASLHDLGPALPGWGQHSRP